MLWLTVASLIGMLVAIGIALRQAKIAEAQKKIAEELAAKQNEQEREVRDWQVRHETVAIQLSRISPHQMMGVPPGTMTMVYTTVFPDRQLRLDIETYVVELVDSRTRFTPRHPSPHELRSPALRETVKTVERILDECRRDRLEVFRFFT